MSQQGRSHQSTFQVKNNSIITSQLSVIVCTQNDYLAYIGFSRLTLGSCCYSAMKLSCFDFNIPCVLVRYPVYRYVIFAQCIPCKQMHCSCEQLLHKCRRCMVFTQVQSHIIIQGHIHLIRSGQVYTHARYKRERI